MEKSPEQLLTQGDSLPLPVLQSQKFDLLQPLAQLSLGLSGSDIWDQGNTGHTYIHSEEGARKDLNVCSQRLEAAARPTVPEAHIQSVHHTPITHRQVGVFYICKAKELGQS